MDCPVYGLTVCHPPLLCKLPSNGFTFKQVGDHLGHRSSAATRIYAKVDLNSLREVAEIDLRGIL